MGVRGASWGRPGASWGPLGASRRRLGASWGVLGVSWGRLGASWGRLGASWGRLGPSWGRLGAVLGPSWAVLGPSWGRLGPQAVVNALPVGGWGVPGRGRGGVNPSPEDLGEGGSSNYQPLNASAQRDLGWRIHSSHPPRLPPGAAPLAARAAVPRVRRPPSPCGPGPCPAGAASRPTPLAGPGLPGASGSLRSGGCLPPVGREPLLYLSCMGVRACARLDFSAQTFVLWRPSGGLAQACAPIGALCNAVQLCAALYSLVQFCGPNR